MKKVLKWVGLLLGATVLLLAVAAYWLFSWDDIDAPELPGQLESGTMDYQGRERSWLAYVPASKSANPALLISYHGSRGDGASMRAVSFYGFDVQAERSGFIALYPDGVEKHWNDCRKSASYAANKLGIDDVGFTRALIARMVEDHGVDPGRVFVTGMSNGGHMVYRLALEAPDLIAGAVAFVANMPAADNTECVASGEAVPMMVINGTEDSVNPYGGGVVGVSGDTSRGLVMSSLESARYWAELAGYKHAPVETGPTDTHPDDGTMIQTLVWKAEGKPSVELVTVIGGGHTIPHPQFRIPRILGRTSHEFDATERAWTFFSQQR